MKILKLNHKNIIIYLLYLSLLILSPAIYAYNFPSISTQEDIYELFYQNEITEDETNNLIFLLENPLDLNHADKEALLLLPNMDIKLAKKIIELRETKKGFTKISELNSIPEISEEMVNKWFQFITILPKEKKYFLNKLQFYNNLDDENPNYITNEIIMRQGQYYIGLLGNVNSAESYNLKKGIPKYYLLYQNKGFIKKFILGTYRVKFGQGLTLSNNRQNEISGDISKTRKFYGSAFTLNPFKKTFISYLFSAPNKDIESNYQEILYGINFHYEIKKELDFGITWYKSELKLSNDSTYISWYEKIPNNYLSGSGIYLKYQLDNYNFYSEITKMNSNSTGAIMKIVSEYSKTISTSIFRYYEKNFINPYSLSFASSDDEPDNTDEKGVFFKIAHKLNKEFTILGYYDFWQHQEADVSSARKNIQMQYLFSRYLEMGIERCWKFENIESPSEINNIIKLNFIVTPKLNAAITGKETKNNLSLDRTYSIKLSQKLNEFSQFEYRIKTDENDINNSNEAKWEYYIQTIINFKENTQFSARYTQTDNSETKQNLLKAELKLLFEP